MFVLALLLGSTQIATSQIIYRIPAKAKQANTKNKGDKARQKGGGKAKDDRSKQSKTNPDSDADSMKNAESIMEVQSPQSVPLIAGEVITAEGTLVVADADGRALSPLSDETVPNMLGEKMLRGKPVRLFDGASLSGWAKGDGSPSKNWVVEDGTLYRKKKGGDLYHSDWYRDFQLSFEWKLLAGGNSGVKYRVKKYGKKALGCEYQLQDDKGKDYHVHATGGLYALYAPTTNKVAPKVGEWNTSTIVVAGYRAQHWLNGDLVVDLTFGDSDWYTRVENSKFKPYENFGLNRSGRIFLQDHGNPIWFRNIVLVPLDSSQQNPMLGKSDSAPKPRTLSAIPTPVKPLPEKVTLVPTPVEPTPAVIPVPSVPFEQTETSGEAPGFEANERDR